MLTEASFHAQSVGKVKDYGDIRSSDNERILTVVKHYPNIVLGADWNGSTQWDSDPQPEIPLREVMTVREVDFVHNRHPANVLEYGGLVDLAAHQAKNTNHAIETTTGCRPTREGPQRLDRLYAWQTMAERVCSVTVVKNELAGKLSDHYPVVMELDISPARIYL